MKRWWLFFACLVGLDAASKAWAGHFVPPLGPQWLGYPFGGIAVWDCGAFSFCLNTVGNSGAAWGLFQGYSGILFALRIVIIGGLFVYLLSGRERRVFPLWLILAGAVGNAIDYWLYGHVIDFLHFRFFEKTFPLFNAADSFITVGVALLLLMPEKKGWKAA